jgi:sigma-B regulation protein RsbU (phosphoserine phosphatase)
MKAIENFELVAEMLEKQAYEKELEITSSIQKSILPVKPIESSHFELGFISRPAKIMGGDFFDFYGFSKNEFTFHIADVSGKSLPAALFMAITSSIIKTLLQDYKDPSEMMKKANDLVYQNSHSGMFVTLFYLFLNTDQQMLKFASAGHNEQFIYRSQNDSFIFMEAKGIPLGVIDSSLHGPFKENFLKYENDDLVVLYTDGIVEAIDETKEEFGIERFKALIKKIGKEDAQTIVNRVFEEVNRFAGNEPQFDDFTLLILKMRAGDKKSGV